jgi:hypothetical protein
MGRIGQERVSGALSWTESEKRLLEAYEYAIGPAARTPHTLGRSRG